MTHTVDSVSARARAGTRVRGVVAAIFCVATTALAVLRPYLPQLPADLYYSQGFAPGWATVAGAAFGLVPAVALAGRLRLPWRVVLAATVGGAGLLTWSAAGVVLDLFRLFFQVTGIPAGTFAVVDWPAFAVRAVSLVALVAVVVAGSRHGRSSAVDTCVWGRRLASWRWLGYAGVVLATPYPGLKLYWAIGGSLLRPGEFDEGLPYGELLAFGVAAVGALALSRPWGERLPRLLVLVPGWAGAVALVTTGALAVFGVAAAELGLVEPRDGLYAGFWPVFVVYGSWLLLGLCLAAAAIGYARRRRPVRAGCDR